MPLQLRQLTHLCFFNTTLSSGRLAALLHRNFCQKTASLHVAFGYLLNSRGTFILGGS